jgi:hypothetical protein
LDSGFRIAFVTHLALDHAEEVTCQYSTDRRHDARDDGSLRCGQSTLDHLIDNVHDIVYGRGDEGRVGTKRLVGVESQVKW